MPPHEFLGKDLASLQARGRLAGADDGQPLFFELIDDARDQRRFRPDNGQVRPQPLRQAHDGLCLREVDGNALRFLRDAGIPGRTVEFLHPLALMQLPCQRVFPTTGPEYENSHKMAYTMRIGLALSIR